MQGDPPGCWIVVLRWLGDIEPADHSGLGAIVRTAKGLQARKSDGKKSPCARHGAGSLLPQPCREVKSWKLVFLLAAVRLTCRIVFLIRYLRLQSIVIHKSTDCCTRRSKSVANIDSRARKEEAIIGQIQGNCCRSR
jgi:hypothetical protein